MILEIETFSVQFDAYRRLSSLCLIMLTFSVPLASFDFHRINKNIKYKGFGRGSLSAPPSSVVGNALVVIDDGIESVNVKNRYQGARVSARRANREPEDGIRWKFVHGRVVVVR